MSAQINHWRVTALLGLACGVEYMARADVSVAQERMVPALGLTMVGMGAISAWGFQLPYALFQIPGGMLGERVGARKALAISLMLCSSASLLAALVPLSGGVPILVASRVLLGIAQAAVFPVAAMAVMQYVPAASQVRSIALFIATSTLGAAIAPMLMAPVMELFSWRAVFGLSSALVGVTALIWLWLMPRQAPAVAATAAPEMGDAFAALLRLLRDSRLRRLSLAYVLH